MPMNFKPRALDQLGWGRLLLSFFLLICKTSANSALVGSDHVFMKGAPLVGGSQGLYFDGNNSLIIAQVYGRAISKMNPETGEILEQLGFEDSVAFVDDVTVGNDGTLYWTDSFYFETIFSRSPGGTSVPLLPPGTVPFANPVTLSDDGTRLFYGQCWNPEPTNGVFELSLVNNTTTTLVDEVFGCASNAMDFKDEFLYTPRPYEGTILKIDLQNNNTVSNVTTNWEGVQATKFDSMGNLYATNSRLGEVARINLTHPDTFNNREVIAQFPPGWIDNFAFDQEDRLYISSTSDATVVELLSSGDKRIVSPGEGFSVPMGIALMNKTIFTVHPGALFGFDIETGERVIALRSIPGGTGVLTEPTSVSVWGNNLVLMSSIAGVLEVYNPFTETLESGPHSFAQPIDAHPFRGDLLVTEFATGNIVRAASPDLVDREIIALIPQVAFLAGNDDKVYASELENKTVLQIIADGEILSPPVVVATGFGSPEGIVLRDNTLLVVDGSSETLKEIVLETGEVRTVAMELGFFPAIPGLALGLANDVVVDENNAIYVNGDSANVIYKFATIGTTSKASSTAFPILVSYAIMALSLLLLA